MASTWGVFGARPHVVLTLVDDWSWEAWPRSNATTQQRRMQALLPHIKETFVRDGIVLARHYAYKECAPSRQALLSGRMPIHNNENNVNCVGLSLDMHTLAEKLKTAGYRTAFRGKWNAGMASDWLTPSRRGFDSSLGFLKHAHDHFTHASYDPSQWSGTALDFFVEDRFDIGPTHPAVLNHTYSTHLYGDEAVKLIVEHPTDGPPLFLFLSLSAPHTPLVAPEDLVQRATLASGWSRSNAGWDTCAWQEALNPIASPVGCTSNLAHSRLMYEAMVAGVDDAIGRLTRALDESDMLANTLMIFTSDNGGVTTLGSGNEPLRGGKYHFLEGGIRTVTAMGGGIIPPHVRGTTSNSWMHISDWYATLCYVAGVDPSDSTPGVPPIDSKSMWPEWRPELLQDGTSSTPRTMAISGDALIHVAADGSAHKLLHGTYCECGDCTRCIRGSLICNGGCVFDLVNDPGEARDLASSQPHLLNALQQLRREATASWWQTPASALNPECTIDDIYSHASASAVIQPWIKAPPLPHPPPLPPCWPPSPPTQPSPLTPRPNPTPPPSRPNDCASLEGKVDLQALTPPEWCNGRWERKVDAAVCERSYVTLPAGVARCAYDASTLTCAAAALSAACPPPPSPTAPATPAPSLPPPLLPPPTHPIPPLHPPPILPSVPPPTPPSVPPAASPASPPSVSLPSPPLTLPNHPRPTMPIPTATTSWIVTVVEVGPFFGYGVGLALLLSGLADVCRRCTASRVHSPMLDRKLAATAPCSYCGRALDRFVRVPARKQRKHQRLQQEVEDVEL